MFKALASGTIVDVIDGKAVFPTCNWLVREFKSTEPYAYQDADGQWVEDYPEFDDFASTFNDVDCGARLIVLEGVALENGHTCENGHENLSYEYYATSGREAQDAAAERNQGDEFDRYTDLSHIG